MIRALAGIALLAAALPPGAALATQATADIEHGRHVYETRCYYCHGYAGDARTAAADVLVPPPRDFTALAPGDLSVERMESAVRDGRPGTAMQGFGALLGADDVRDVVAYVRAKLMDGGSAGMRYHSIPNGWTGDPHDSPAAPWVLGEHSLDEDWEALDPAARTGRRVYLDSCMSCHTPVDRRGPANVWRNLAVSYPPGNYIELEHDDHDEAAMAGEPTAVFERHEDPLPLDLDDPRARAGEALYARACADCHAGNGSGRNWIGSFIDPPPPDLRDAAAASVHSREAFLAVVRAGVPGTSMPAFGHVLGDADIESLARYFEVAFRPLSD